MDENTKYEETHTAYPFPGLRKKPCDRIVAEAYSGPWVCEVLTRRRVWLPSIYRKAVAVDCGRHGR